MEGGLKGGGGLHGGGRVKMEGDSECLPPFELQYMEVST